MKEFGYKQSQGDHTLFIKHSAAGGVMSKKLIGFLIHFSNLNDNMNAD